jgi:hypothetical protein
MNHLAHKRPGWDFSIHNRKIIVPDMIFTSSGKKKNLFWLYFNSLLSGCFNIFYTKCPLPKKGKQRENTVYRQGHMQLK